MKKIVTILVLLSTMSIQAQDFSESRIDELIEAREFEAAQGHFSLLNGIPLQSPELQFKKALVDYKVYSQSFNIRTTSVESFPFDALKTFNNLFEADAVQYSNASLYRDTLKQYQIILAERIQFEEDSLNSVFLNKQNILSSRQLYEFITENKYTSNLKYKLWPSLQCTYANVCIDILEQDPKSLKNSEIYDRAVFANDRCLELDTSGLYHPENAIRLSIIHTKLDELVGDRGAKALDIVSLALRCYQRQYLSHALDYIDKATHEEPYKSKVKTWVFCGYIYKDLYKTNRSNYEYRLKAIEAYLKAIELDADDEFADECEKSLRFLSSTLYNDAAKALDQSNYKEADIMISYFLESQKATDPEADLSGRIQDYNSYKASKMLSQLKQEEIYDSNLAKHIDSLYVRILVNDPSNKSAYKHLTDLRLIDRLRKAVLFKEVKKENKGLHQNVEELNKEIENRKIELESYFERIGIQKDVYNKLMAVLASKEKETRASQILLLEKTQELETKQLELETNETRLSSQRAELEATTTEMINVENRMSKALQLLDSQKLVSYAISGIALLILILGIIAFKNYRKQRKQATIIALQRDEVESQRDEVKSQRDEIHEQHEQLEEKNKEITDSIVYAKRIQQAILPPARLVSQYLENSFILYKPKDIVAGDFYWVEPAGDLVIFAAADCTGHGVPGAMVSVVCSNALNRAVREFGLTEPAKILDKTLEIVIERFEKSEEEVKDGMDIALCALNTNTNQLQYAGANNPLWIISPNAEIKSSPASTLLSTGLERGAPTERGVFLHEIKATKQPIGKYSEPKPYKNHSISLQAGDSVYVFTDGFPDQFGGEKGKKLKTKAFKELLLSIQDKSMSDQHKIIDDYFENWRGEQEQIDDVCVIGVRI